MNHCPLNTKFLKKKFIIPNNIDKFEEFSENFTFSRSLMLPQQIKESAAGTMCLLRRNRVNLFKEDPISFP